MGEKVPKATFNHIFSHKKKGKRWFPSYDETYSKNSPGAMRYWPKSICWIRGYIIHPQASSCLVFKAPRATPLLPCSCVAGTLPVALTCSPKPPAVLNIHKSTPHLYLKNNIELNQPHNLHTEVCIQRKPTWRLFKNFKSQCSVTKHITPIIKLTYYTYEWYCLNTQSSTP